MSQKISVQTTNTEVKDILEYVLEKVFKYLLKLLVKIWYLWLKKCYSTWVIQLGYRPTDRPID